jgi:pimeloyl-ACP methyl ester carboxylesterase
MSLETQIPQLTHGMADIEPGVRLHYVTAGEGDRVIVLLHGFPQTWREWRHVMHDLTQNGFRVIAPDYRGAGHSLRPAGGFDKRTMAGDVYQLLRRHLDIKGPVAFAGHDIGLMVAYAYAQAYRDEVSHLAIIDAPLPGTTVFDHLKSDPRAWHFAFHNARDLAEMLVQGRERQYLQSFFGTLAFNPTAIRGEDFDEYVNAYSAPGAMRCGFELYRAFERDAEDNREALRANGKLTIPVSAIGGAVSAIGPHMEAMAQEVAESVTALRIPGTGHWIAEENPKALTAGLLQFLQVQ